MRSATRKKTHEDKHSREWIHTQPCIVTGRYGVTMHHVRQFGGPRVDRRGIPLVKEPSPTWLEGKKGNRALRKER